MPIGRPSKPGPCTGCGREGLVFPTYRPGGEATSEAAIREAVVVLLCSACRVRGADFHGAVARARGEPLVPPAPAPAGGARAPDRT